MSTNKVDLSKLKEEIHTRKEKKGQVTTNSSVSSAPKDSFLNGLVESLSSGAPTQASQTIKAIDAAAKNKEIVRNGGTPVANVNTTAPAPVVNNNQGLADAISTSQGSAPTNIGQGSDRDMQLWEEFERRKKEVQNGGAANTMQQLNNVVQNQPQGNVNTLNEGMVNELIESKFASVVEQAMKNSIVEIYAAAKMRESIEESRELIREIVIDTIRELQKKKKPQ